MWHVHLAVGSEKANENRGGMMFANLRMIGQTINQKGDMKRELTAEQQAARDARRAKFRELVKQVANMNPDQKTQFMGKVGSILTADGGAIGGFTNTMLLYMQFGEPSIVGGFRQWLKHGRAVKKGEHGAMIWVPVGTAKPETVMESAKDTNGEPDEKRFIIGTVFDISQTQEIETSKAA